jgi:hypothetical protein
MNPRATEGMTGSRDGGIVMPREESQKTNSFVQTHAFEQRFNTITQKSNKDKEDDDCHPSMHKKP